MENPPATVQICEWSSSTAALWRSWLGKSHAEVLFIVFSHSHFETLGMSQHDLLCKFDDSKDICQPVWSLKGVWAFFSIPNFQLWKFHKKMWKRDVYPQTVKPHQGFPRCHEATPMGLATLCSRRSAFHIGTTFLQRFWKCRSGNDGRKES